MCEQERAREKERDKENKKVEAGQRAGESSRWCLSVSPLGEYSLTVTTGGPLEKFICPRISLRGAGTFSELF